MDFILIKPFLPPPLCRRCLLGLAENDTTDQTEADSGSNACKSLQEKKKEKTGLGRTFPAAIYFHARKRR